MPIHSAYLSWSLTALADLKTANPDIILQDFLDATQAQS